MTRAEFEELLGTPGKRIAGPIELAPDTVQPHKLMAQVIVKAKGGREATIYVRFDTRTLSKTINVVVEGVGPICRLDVDGTRHRNAGRTHKHQVQTPECSNLNLPQAEARPELSGYPVEKVFDIFCIEAGIRNEGLKLRVG